MKERSPPKLRRAAFKKRLLELSELLEGASEGA